MDARTEVLQDTGRSSQGSQHFVIGTIRMEAGMREPGPTSLRIAKQNSSLSKPPDRSESNTCLRRRAWVCACACARAFFSFVCVRARARAGVTCRLLARSFARSVGSISTKREETRLCWHRMFRWSPGGAM